MEYSYWEDGDLIYTNQKDIADMMRSVVRGEMYDHIKVGECVCPDFKLCRDDCSHCKYCRQGMIESSDVPVENDDGEDFFAEIVDKHASVEDQVIWKISVEEACKYLEKKRQGLSKIFLLRLSGYNLKEIGEYFGKNTNDVNTELRRIRRYLEPIRESMFGI